MKKWVERHLILAFGICSVFFAVLIHILFSISAPTEWLVARWSAGDILTYVSTVALALLAVWQNQKFKEESDVSEERLERLAVQANELAVVSKIIEIEMGKLERLKKALDDFSDACDPQVLVEVYRGNSSFDNKLIGIQANMNAAEKKMDDGFVAITREVREDENDPLTKVVGESYACAKKFAAKVLERPSTDHTSDIEILLKMRDRLFSAREAYIQRKTKMLDRVVYGNMTLEEIREMYRQDTTTSQKDG